MAIDKRQQIKDILFFNKKNITWLTERIPGVDWYYQLSDKAKTFDTDVYDETILQFKKAGFITSENERCERFADQLIQVNGIISHSTYLLNSNAAEFLKDHILDYKEKKKLLEIVEKMQKEFNNEIESITKLIEG